MAIPSAETPPRADGPDASLVNRGKSRLVRDRLAFPLLALLSEERARTLDLTPLDDERVLASLRHCEGLLLDVGCGANHLVRIHGRGVGVDIHRWPTVDVLCDTMRLPFADATFDTVSLLAALNHIPRRDRHAVLREIHRVLRPEGLLLVTMIPAWLGRVSHRIREPHDPDQVERGMHEDEDPGLSAEDVVGLLEGARFRVEARERFLYALNSLYRARRA